MSKKRILWGMFVVALIGVPAYVLAWWYATQANLIAPSSNAILVIAPYWHSGTWVFDDPSVGLRREPFVAGVPEMINVVVKDIPEAKKGFRLLFSANPFPDYQKKLTWLRAENGGNYYEMEDPPLQGWICPAMFKYYRSAPQHIYVKAEAMQHSPPKQAQSEE